MNKLLVGSIMLLSLVSHSMLAQRHIPGQAALGVNAGIVDNVPSLSSLKTPGNGFGLSIDYVWYQRNERYWKASTSYMRKYYAADQPAHPTVEQYFLSIDYVPRGVYTTRRWLYIAPTLGAFTGYENVNRNNKSLPEGIIQNNSTFTIGPQLGLESEVYIAPTTCLTAGITERYVPFSDVSNFRTIGYIGIRFSFFR